MKASDSHVASTKILNFVYLQISPASVHLILVWIPPRQRLLLQTCHYRVNVEHLSSPVESNYSTSCKRCTGHHTNWLSQVAHPGTLTKNSDHPCRHLIQWSIPQTPQLLLSDSGHRKPACYDVLFKYAQSRWSTSKESL